MQTDDRIKSLLDATPDTLAAVDAALAGKTNEKPQSLRLRAEYNDGGHLAC